MKIKSGEMANRLSITRMTLGRWVKGGIWPAPRRTKGGQAYWIETPSLKGRITLLALGTESRKARIAKAFYKKKPKRIPIIEAARPFAPTDEADLWDAFQKADTVLQNFVEDTPFHWWDDKLMDNAEKLLAPFVLIHNRLKKAKREKAEGRRVKPPK